MWLATHSLYAKGHVVKRIPGDQTLKDSAGAVWYSYLEHCFLGRRGILFTPFATSTAPFTHFLSLYTFLGYNGQ